uniref:enoyl-CoA hydratase-related protein n=1 Tax=Polymorphobacter sp. TaxID=1909290 RepID=UPI003F6E881C
MSVTLTTEGDIAVVTINNPPVNALSAAVRDGLVAAFTSLTPAQNPGIRAVVLLCSGRTFIAGADISEFGKPSQGASFHQVLTAIEQTPIPVVAALHGTALGGGLETAMACHYRIASPSARLGLPEVKLGLLPGAGGTQRLPRLVGVEKALAMITTGTPISAAEALAAGLIDATTDADLREAALAFARQLVAEAHPPRRIRDDDSRLGTPESLAPLLTAFRAKNAKAFKGQHAPEAIIRCIEAAVTLPFDQGLAVERTEFETLMAGLQSKALRHVFFAERQAAKIDGLDPAIQPLPIASVGVIGAGTMGGGIAMNFLTAGIPVTLVETRQDALDRGIATIRKNYESSAAKGRFPASEVEARMARLRPSLSLEDLGHADLIIEAV